MDQAKGKATKKRGKAPKPPPAGQQRVDVMFRAAAIAPTTSATATSPTPATLSNAPPSSGSSTVILLFCVVEYFN
jgi:hypothetical protein